MDKVAECDHGATGQVLAPTAATFEAEGAYSMAWR